jgi:ABC-type bacteriocin/lantibiotic exporter with double-glycine peptidase domain
VLGETGAGKTTLIRLMLALLLPKEGQIEVYAQERAEQVSPLHRCNFVYVPQGNTLLSGTIRENLLMGNPAATDADLWQVLHLACADFVTDLPQGLDTICSEAGGGLSEGQAQRIAIARALLRGRSIMLFDEATSALDQETERRLLKNVLSDKQKTVIFITHRPAVVDYCDQVLNV